MASVDQQLNNEYAQKPDPGLTIFLVLITAALVFLGLKYFLKIPMDGDWISTFWTASIAIAGLVVTAESIRYLAMQVRLSHKQFKAHHDLERRKFASQLALEFKETTREQISLLNKHFGYSELTSTDKIPLQDIHDEICVIADKSKNRDGERYEQNPVTGKMKVDEEKGGEELRKAIMMFLDKYEHIVTCINHQIVDEEFMKKLLTGSIIKAYNNFGEYIDHYNKKMRPERHGLIWKNLTEYAEKLIAEDKSKEGKDQREATG